MEGWVERAATTNVDGSLGGPSRSASSLALPRLSLASHPDRAQQAQPHRAHQEHAREVFLAGLLNEDLQNLTRWHGGRPHHEQKRFLRSVNTLYKAFEAADTGAWAAQARASQAVRQAAEREAAVATVAARAAAAAVAAVEDPLNGPPRETPRALGPSASDPGLLRPARPIEVFEQRKRKHFRSRQGEEDPNTLAMWLEGQSVSSQTTATTQSTQLTRFSNLTRTSSGGSSICSEPGTTNQLHYRIHKRAAAVNRNKWAAADQHNAGNLKDGIPNIGFPECERMTTQHKEAFGDARMAGSSATKNMYQSVLRGNSHPFVAQFLETAMPEDKEQFAGMVRSLEYLRRAHVRETTSLQRQEMDLAENSRLWRPPKQRPVFDTSEVNLSRVPLGTFTQVKAKKALRVAAAPPPPPAGLVIPEPPASPSVSGLGSLPLSRLSTPAVH